MKSPLQINDQMKNRYLIFKDSPLQKKQTNKKQNKTRKQKTMVYRHYVEFDLILFCFSSEPISVLKWGLLESLERTKGKKINNSNLIRSIEGDYW